MKIKKIIIVIIILIIFFSIICFKNYYNYKFSKVVEQRPKNVDKDIKIIQIEEMYNSEEISEDCINIIDNEENLIDNISPLENKMYDILNSDDVKYEDIVILADVAQKSNLKLNNNEISEINNMAEALIEVCDIDNTEILREDYQKYLTNIQYYSKINEQILDEITNNSLTIDDKELQDEINLYQKMQEEAKLVVNEEEKYEQLKKIYSKIEYIEDLYIQKLLDKYRVEK